MIAGVWGNSNYDSQKEGSDGPRPKLLEEIESGFQKAIRQIRTGKEDKTDDINWTDPFFSAIKAPRIGSEAVIDASREEERQQRERENASLMKELDQG